MGLKGKKMLQSGANSFLLKAPYSSKIDILLSKKVLKNMNTIINCGICPVSILYKSIAGRYRSVRVADGPITTRYRFITNASWVKASKISV